MGPSLLYHDLAKQEKETVFGYFLLRLLKEEELWKAEHKEVYVYIASLLLSLIGSSHQIQSQKYLVRYETDLARILDETQDLASHYYYFKFNADDLLVTCGIFKPIPDQNYFSNMERGKRYYKMAARCSQQIHRKETPLTEVFENLSAAFEEYQRRLLRLRRSYLHFVKKLSPEEISYLIAQVDRLTFS